jgi:hypothetical protein
MSDDTREVPKEGSNHIDHEDGQKRSNISEIISSPHVNAEQDDEADPQPEEIKPTEGDNGIPQPDATRREPQE